MTYGPMEFAAYLKRKDAGRGESAAVKAAREAAPKSAPGARPENNRLTVISGGPLRSGIARAAREEAVCVYEAVTMRAPYPPQSDEPVSVLVRPTNRPMVLVLSSHQTVRWEIELAPEANLRAVLLAGYGQSTVVGAGDVMVTSIGGFYAFKRGTAEFRHLESEVLRCTGRNIEFFQSEYAGHRFEIGDG
ncbi:MAG TPA: hypothetical protein VFU13_21265 [Steroidobacteraceae bacterium]|nr:hypothetical protein [Steroidobacteraceae bacterium]